MSIIDGVQAANETLIEIAKIGAMAAFRAPKMAKSKIKVETLTGEDRQSRRKRKGQEGKERKEMILPPSIMWYILNVRQYERKLRK